MPRLPVLLVVSALCGCAHTAEVFETFNGTGSFVDLGQHFIGFDLEDWSILATNQSQLGEKTLEGVYRLEATGGVGPTGGNSEKLILEPIPWRGSFVQRIELRDYKMSTNDDRTGFASLEFRHAFNADDITEDALGMKLSMNERGTPALSTSIRDIDNNLPEDEVVHEVSFGENIALELIFYDDLSLAEFRYDNDIDDAIPPVELRRRTVKQVRKGDRYVSLFAGAFSFDTYLQAGVDNFSIRSLEPGDFNYDAVLDFHDMELLSAAIQSGENDLRRDINDDGMVDVDDATDWVHDVLGSFYGDSNLDGLFDSADLVAVFTAAQYEDDIDANSDWQSGDWNFDGDFTSSDLVFAFQDGGYEKGLRIRAVVPEPKSTLWVKLLVVFSLLSRQFPPTRQT